MQKKLEGGGGGIEGVREQRRRFVSKGGGKFSVSVICLLFELFFKFYL